MKTLCLAALWFGVLAVPSLAAVNKDGGQPSVNPCGPGSSACAGRTPEAEIEAEPAPAEPMVIFLDANGETLVRMPLSRFRDNHPEATLPPELRRDR